MSDSEMDTSPDTEADTASGGAPEPRKPEGGHDPATGVDAPPQTHRDDTTDENGTPVENPSG